MIRSLISKERNARIIVLWIMLPFIIFLVFFILSGYSRYTSALGYAFSLILTITYCVLVYYLYARIADFIRKKFPALGDIFKRIILMLLACYTLNSIQIYAIHYLHKYHGLFSSANFFDNPRRATFYLSICSTVITVLNEAAFDWSSWKRSVAETEQLKSSYQKTKLLGLKAQMSPHFLFNCFNTLSSLIHDNEAEAEKFLDEMTKVHRYMLRNDHESMVPLRDELKAVGSYLHLIKVRYGSSIEIFIDVKTNKDERFLPPLSLQTIIENIIYSNVISKSEPLKIVIESDNDTLNVTNTVNHKMVYEDVTFNEGFENLITKYRLLNHKNEVRVMEDNRIKKVTVPLIAKP